MPSLPAPEPKHPRPPQPAPHPPWVRHPQPAPHAQPALSRSLWQWLLTGLALMAIFPAARGHSEWLGWLPFWLSIAPAISLALLHRHSLAQRLRRQPRTAPALVFTSKPNRPAQARRLTPAKAGVQSHLRAA